MIEDEVVKVKEIAPISCFQPLASLVGIGNEIS